MFRNILDINKNLPVLGLLDPGHGGTDPGASGNGYKEKDLALKLCIDIQQRLGEHLLNFALTRKDDRFISLGDRSKMANDLNVNIFLSVHFNSAINNKAKGLETFCFTGSTGGKELATKIQNELVNARLCLSNRGVKQANFSVLRRTNMKAALLETCFINNKEDIDFFLNNYDKFVEIITKAIVEYFEKTYVAPNTVIKVPSKPVITIVEGRINIILIGEHIVTEGFIKEGTSYVDVNGSYISIREVLQKLHLEVNWDNDLKIITADTGGTFIKDEGLTDILLLGNKINVKTYMHDNKHCLYIENAYVPIRDIFESLGFTVKWNDKDKMIWILK